MATKNMTYPVISREVMLALFGYKSEKEYQAHQRKRQAEWNKTHKWIEPICAKCGKRTMSSGKIGIERGVEYYCARCSAEPTTIEINEPCECLKRLEEVFNSLNIQLWAGDASECPTIECPKHHTSASFMGINQYD